MNPADPSGWKDITGSVDDQTRQQSRRRLRESGRRRGAAILAGAILLSVGFILFVAGIGSRLTLLLLPGMLGMIAGMILLQLYTVRVFRLRDRGRGYVSIEESVALVNPLEEGLNKERQRIADRGFDEFIKDEEKLDADAKQPIKVRCLSCQALNDEQANFCAGCGSRLR